jgi:hypothetical protein
LPIAAGPMIVGPITDETWPMAGPMNERPAPWHTDETVPATAPWPFGPNAVAHGPNAP